MSNLERLTDEQLTPLLNESEHVFLPTKNNPNETATSLVEKFKNNTNYDVFGRVVEDRAVSYIIALSGRNNTEIAIGPMYVAKDSRGNGVGKQQIADFIQLFTERGYTSIFTKTWLGNAASRHSFESLGFIKIGREDGDRVDGDSTISYELRIQTS
jgi:L-amino acid N-acyltransferase YncA